MGRFATSSAARYSFTERTEYFFPPSVTVPAVMVTLFCVRVWLRLNRSRLWDCSFSLSTCTSNCLSIIPLISTFATPSTRWMRGWITLVTML